MPVGTDCYLLPADAAEALRSDIVGNLVPVVMQAEAPVPFSVLDNFDGSLRRSDRLLLDTGHRLELMTAREPMATQPSVGSPCFVTDLATGVVKGALADLPPLRRLLCIRFGILHNISIAFVDPEHKTRCRVQLQTFLGETGGSVVIATLNALRGYDKALAKLCDRVEDLGGRTLSVGDLYLGLLPDVTPYNAKPVVAFARDESAIDAASDIIAAYLPVVRANEAGIIADDDTEFLHDYRIALRKIRSVLSLFKGVYRDDQTTDLKARLSALMGPTGSLRDLDVYLLEKQKFYGLLPSALHKGLDTTFAMLAAERKTEQAKLAHHLCSRRYAHDITSLERLFADRKHLMPGPNAALGPYEYASAQIWKRYRKICRIASAIGPDTADVEVHDLRIHCKKLRYLMEFFASLFPQAAFKSLLKPLKILQDNLGMINDYAVQQINLQQFLRKVGNWPDGVDLEVAQSVGALTAALHAQQAEERAKTVKSFAAFNSPQIQQTFRVLFRAQKEKQ